MCKVISIVNQKGGCSKTTSAVNIGIGLANAGKKVVLIDADAQGSLTASANQVPITQNSKCITYFHNFFKIMRDENHCFSIVAKLFD